MGCVWSPQLPCLALGNVICENQWGGVDIRHGGDPVLRNNLISCGYSDGVVVGERGKGLIEGNVIYGKEASSGKNVSCLLPCPLGLAVLPSTSGALWSCGGCPGGGAGGACPGVLSQKQCSVPGVQSANLTHRAGIFI